MIWNTAALALLLASSAAAVNKKTLIKDMNRRHLSQTKLLYTKVKTGRKLTGTEKARALADNTGFFNYKYYADDACSNDPYGYAGYGIDSCIPYGDGVGSFSITGCSGSGDNIGVTATVYASGDCSGDVDSTVEVIYDGICGAVNDDAAIDDRAQPADDIIDTQQGYVTFSCNTTANKPTSFMWSAYDENDCSTLTMYFGYNQDSCIPLSDGEHYALLTGCKTLLYLPYYIHYFLLFTLLPLYITLRRSRVHYG